MPVIVLLADGVRADTLATHIAAGALPAMARLLAAGGLHEITSAFPSVTGPAYTPFLMGRFPGPVGLPGLRWYDRARTTCSFPDYSRSYVGYQLGAVDRDLDPRAPTIFELVPHSGGALSVITRGLPRIRQLAPLTARAALRAAFTHFRGDVSGWLAVDREIADTVVRRSRDDAFDFLFAAFTGVDKTSHSRGHDSPGVLEALRIVDSVVAALRTDLERRGAWDHTHLWITSDHGHSPVEHHEDLARVVEQHGHRVMAHPWIYRRQPDVAVMVSGNAMAHLYVDLDLRERPFWARCASRVHELADHLLQRASVDLMLVPLDPYSCEVRSRARGTATITRAGDRFTYQRGSGDPLGLGDDLHAVDAGAAHDATRHTDYPDAVVQIAALAASERAGDLMLSAARHWDFRARYEPIPHESSHGALHREHMLVPLLASRPLSGRPRRTTDIMPSALVALGRPVPDGLDGTSFL